MISVTFVHHEVFAINIYQNKATTHWYAFYNFAKKELLDTPKREVFESTSKNALNFPMSAAYNP